MDLPNRHAHRRHAATRVRIGVTTACLALASAQAFVLPSSAHASFIWFEGNTKRFSGSIDSDLVKLKTSDRYSIQLDRDLVAKFRTGAAPQSAQRLKNGHTLVAESGAVVEYDASGDEVYRTSTGAFGGPLIPAHAQSLNDEDVLIVDSAEDNVFVWDKKSGKIQWHYPPASGGLTDPVHATRLSDGTTLICDAGGNRIVKVFSDGDIWTLSSVVPATLKTEKLNAPRSVQGLDNGRLLVTDSGSHRVIEVDPSTRKIVWQFGKTGDPGSSLVRLKTPTSAERLADGTTVIVDSGNRRILSVSKAGVAESVNSASLGLSGLSPLSSSTTPKGTTLVVDGANDRLVEYGYAKGGRYTSDKIDLGSGGAKKRIVRIEAVSTRPTNTAVKIQYSADGKSWKSASGSYVIFATGLTATYVRVRVNLSTSDRSLTPVLHSLQVAYDPIPTAGTASGNWSQLYGQTLTPFGPGATVPGAPGPTAGAKIPGAAGALPQGSAVPGVAATTVYSGYLMQRVANGAQITKDPRGLPGLPIDAAGTTAALLFITTVYGIGVASTTLSQVAHSALQSLKAVLLRSMNG